MWAKCCRLTGSAALLWQKETPKDSVLNDRRNGLKAATHPSRGRGCYDVLNGLDAVHYSLLSRRPRTDHRCTSTPRTRVRRNWPSSCTDACDANTRLTNAPA